MYVKELFGQPKVIIPYMAITNFAGFTNQPDGDGVEIVSNSASDVGKCTIWGTDKTTGLLCVETVVLTGTNAVSTVKVNWDDIFGIFLGDQYGKNITPAVGTITVREASGNQAITTLTAATIMKGMLILDVGGHNVELRNASGKMYYNTIERATATNGIYEVGTNPSVYQVRAPGYLYVISDNTGCSTQVVIFED